MRYAASIGASIVLGGLLLWVPQPLQAQGALERLGNLLNQLDADEQLETEDNRPAGDNERPFLGAMLDELEGDNGLVVTQVNAGGPADRAGLQQGDQIRSVDGLGIGSLDRMGKLLQTKRPGDPLHVEIVRDGEVREVRVTLGSQHNVDPLPPPRDQNPNMVPSNARDPLGVEGGMQEGQPQQDNQRRLGVRVIPITDEVRAQTGISIRRGAYVENVSRGGVADRAGIPAGAVIVSYNDRRVDGPVDLIELVQNSPADRRVPVNFYLGNRLQTAEVYFGDPNNAPPPAPAPAGGMPERSQGIGGQDRPALQLLQRAIGAIEDGQAPGDLLVSPEEVQALRQRVESLEAEVRELRQQIEAMRQADGDAL